MHGMGKGKGERVHGGGERGWGQWGEGVEALQGPGWRLARRITLRQPLPRGAGLSPLPRALLRVARGDFMPFVVVMDCAASAGPVSQPASQP